MDAMDLAGEMERTAGAAVSLHTTLQGGWVRRGRGAGAGPPGDLGPLGSESGAPSWGSAPPGAASQLSQASSKAGGAARGLGSPRVERGEIAAAVGGCARRADSALDEAA